MRLGGAAASVLVVVVVAVGCANPAPSDGLATSSPSAIVSGSPAPPASPSATGGPVPIDPALLAHLPEVVADLVLSRTDEGLSDAVGDPALAANAEAVAAAVAADPEGGDLLYAAVVRLRPGVMNDEFYRDWRDTFDEGACEPAGGVSGKAEAEIGGRRTFIGSCEGGLLTYHVWLGNSGVLVSVWSVGQQRLGERLVEDLRD